MRRPEVEILFFRGCPNVAAARKLVDEVAAELRVTPDVRLVEVPGPGDVERLRFLGSPSVRVDGSDVEPGADTRSDYVFACRVYRGPGGVGGRPEEAWVRDALARSVA